MGGEQEVKQQVGVPKSSGNQDGKAQLADMNGRPFLDGAVPVPEPRTARGRPSIYSQELAERIFDEIECGLSIEKIATLPGMPSKRTIFNWRRTIPEFRRGYFRSMDFRRFDHMDEMLTVSTAMHWLLPPPRAKSRPASRREGEDVGRTSRPAPPSRRRSNSSGA